MTDKTLLAIENVSISLPPGADRPFAIEDVSLTVNRNEIVCLVGESGSGKSMTAHAILRLLPDRTGVAQGQHQLQRQLTSPRPMSRRCASCAAAPFR